MTTLPTVTDAGLREAWTATRNVVLVARAFGLSFTWTRDRLRSLGCMA